MINTVPIYFNENKPIKTSRFYHYFNYFYMECFVCWNILGEKKTYCIDSTKAVTPK